MNSRGAAREKEVYVQADVGGTSSILRTSTLPLIAKSYLQIFLLSFILSLGQISRFSTKSNTLAMLISQ